MSKLPVLKFKDVDRFLLKLGFERKRQTGSHIFYSHSDGRTTVVPNHPGKDIGRGLLRKILSDVNATASDLTLYR